MAWGKNLLSITSSYLLVGITESTNIYGCLQVVCLDWYQDFEYNEYKGEG
ncbi:18928_t:CDS:2 [Gigaspora rosea]|nr:18928_t:CDS:2 [Gigaspora rosea]